VLETTGVSRIGSMEFKVPATKRDVPRTITIPKGVKVPPRPNAKPEGTYEEGTETIKIAGAELKTTWYKYRSAKDGLKTDAKLWISEGVPGGMVKMEATTSGLIDASSRMELVEFKTP
jgi:hypothetical protein